MKRHNDAIAIQGGACNPIAICNTLLRATEEIRTETGSMLPTDAILNDPAFRLMVHQLAFLTRSGDVDSNYNELMTACERAA